MNLDILTFSEITAILSLIASFIYLLGFFGINFVQSLISLRIFITRLRPSLIPPPKTFTHSSKDDDDEGIIDSVVSGTTPSYSLESKLRDCKRAASICQEALQRVTGKSLIGLPLDGFDYEFILGQCCEMPVGYVQIPVGIAKPLLLDGTEYSVPMATTEDVTDVRYNARYTHGKGILATTGVILCASFDHLKLLKIESFQGTESEFRLLRHLFENENSLYGILGMQLSYSTPVGYSCKAVHPIALAKVMNIAQMMKSKFDDKHYYLSGIGGVEWRLVATALMWHRLMGKGVLAADSNSSPFLRIYAHCSKGRAFSSGKTLSIWNLPASEPVTRESGPGRNLTDGYWLKYQPIKCRQISKLADYDFYEGKGQADKIRQILAVGAEPVLSRFDMNGTALSQINCAPQSGFSVSFHSSGPTCITDSLGWSSYNREYGRRGCTARKSAQSLSFNGQYKIRKAGLTIDCVKKALGAPALVTKILLGLALDTSALPTPSLERGKLLSTDRLYMVLFYLDEAGLFVLRPSCLCLPRSYRDLFVLTKAKELPQPGSKPVSRSSIDILRMRDLPVGRSL
ncbi:hypothetical protein IFM89_002185 [Coptis chinensis]|uniref:Uncharacterized protein n=1 Tax=Coptis chinensis TaxID=261450 RepID=A0A835I933_9MAGN|nr:hypothetical protein IFM89_002185 [Coptis chinensis]